MFSITACASAPRVGADQEPGHAPEQQKPDGEIRITQWLSVEPWTARLQRFKSKGNAFRELEFLVLAPKNSSPQSRLNIEVRSSDLLTLYGRGQVLGQTPGKPAWELVKWESSPKLEPDGRYTLVLSSSEKSLHEPWGVGIPSQAVWAGRFVVLKKENCPDNHKCRALPKPWHAYAVVEFDPAKLSSAGAIKFRPGLGPKPLRWE